MKIKKNNKKKLNLAFKERAGFTLLEMIVVVGVFGLLVAASVEIFIALYNVGQKTNVSRNLTQDLRQALETISRESRDAYKLDPYGPGEGEEKENSIEITTKGGNKLRFFCEDDSGNLCEWASPGSVRVHTTDSKGDDLGIKTITSKKTGIVLFRIASLYSWGEENTYNAQPKFEIEIVGKSDQKTREGDDITATLKTAVSKRNYDITYCDLFPCGPTIITKLHPGFPDTYISLFSLSNNKWLFNIRMPFDDYINGSGGIIVKKNKVYAFYRNHFWFLDINTRSWVRINNTPFFPDAGEFTSNYDTGQIYFMTGEDTGAVGDNGLKIWRYDDVSDSWTKLGGNHPHPRIGTNLGVEYHKGKIYTTGYHDPYQSTNGEWLCFSYDLSTETWSREPNLLYRSGIGPGGIVSVGDYLYFLGYTYLDNYQIFWRRNPETGVSERLADTILPTTNHQRRATLTKGVDYIYGASVNDLSRYSINSNNWSLVSSLPYDLGRGRIRFYYVD